MFALPTEFLNFMKEALRLWMNESKNTISNFVTAKEDMVYFITERVPITTTTG
jgi:hypothetical protein